MTQIVNNAIDEVKLITFLFICMVGLFITAFLKND